MQLLTVIDLPRRPPVRQKPGMVYDKTPSGAGLVVSHMEVRSYLSRGIRHCSEW
jgi:hypothetical protein